MGLAAIDFTMRQGREDSIVFEFMKLDEFIYSTSLYTTTYIFIGFMDTTTYKIGPGEFYM